MEVECDLAWGDYEFVITGIVMVDDEDDPFVVEMEINLSECSQPLERALTYEEMDELNPAAEQALIDAWISACEMDYLIDCDTG